MASRYQWFDASPYRAVLYEIADDRPVNRKVAAIEFNHDDRRFMLHLFSNGLPYVESVASFEDKQSAMEQVIAELVARRMNQS